MLIAPPRNGPRIRGYRTRPRLVLDPNHPLSDGLIGFWPLDKGYGTATDPNAIFAEDISQLGNFGRLRTISSYLAGGPGGAIAPVFGSGANDILFRPAYQLPHVFSIVAWINPSSLAVGLILGQVNETDTGDAQSSYKFYLNSTGKLLFYNANVLAAVLNGSVSISTNKWQQVCCVSDGANASTYVNGALDATTAYTTSFGAAKTDGLRVGANNSAGAQPFPGGICLVRLYNRALSAAEIAQLYTEPYAGLFPSSQTVGAISKSITLTGAAATSAAGSFVPEVDKALTGVSATSQAGGFTPSVSVALSGVQASSAPGSFVPTVNPTVTGASATSAAGSFSPSVAITLAGAAAVSHAGSFTPQVAVGLSGVACASAPGILAPAGTDTLVGVSAASHAGLLSPAVAIGLVGVSSTAIAGSFAFEVDKALTGASAASIAGSLVAQPAGVLVGAQANSAPGSFAFEVDKPLIGAAATTIAGVFNPSSAIGLVGVGMTAAPGLFGIEADIIFQGLEMLVSQGRFGIEILTSATFDFTLQSDIHDALVAGLDTLTTGF